MNRRLVCFLILLVNVAAARSAVGQPPKPEDAPGTDVQAGASFVGVRGNAESQTLGADFSMSYRQAPWRFDAAASTVHTSGDNVQEIDRDIESTRVKRDLTPMIAATAGQKLEHDPNAGIDLRSIIDGGLAWKLVRQPSWTLDGITSLAWNHEHPIGSLEATVPSTNHTVGVLELLSKVPFNAAGSTTQRVTWYPDFTNYDGTRVEAEITAQAAMSQRIALKLGYLVRWVNVPLPGLKNTDTTTTASIVVTWKNPPPAPKAP
jgi:putative salt-induced outer membrane protein YdiY